MHTAVDVLDSKKNSMDLNHNLNNYSFGDCMTI